MAAFRRSPVSPLQARSCVSVNVPSNSPIPLLPFPRRCAALVRVLRQSRGAPLLSMAVAEAMAAVVCEPGSRTTDQSTLETLLQARRRSVCGFGAARLLRCCWALTVRCVACLAVRCCSSNLIGLAANHLQETAALGRPLFSLFSHPAPRVAHAAALLMRAVAEGGAEAAQPMREAALTGGSVHSLCSIAGRCMCS